MPQTIDPNGRLDDVDIIQELKLRRWARENYVLPMVRLKNWHPVVLEEMRLRDVEVQQRPIPQKTGPECGMKIVPLIPGGIRIVHPPHPRQAPSNLNTARAEIQSWIPG